MVRRLDSEVGHSHAYDWLIPHCRLPAADGRRAALRYTPSTSVFERHLRPVDGKTGVAVNFARRPLWLLTGVERSGRNELEVGHRRPAA